MTGEEIEELFDRACALDREGENDEARAAYIALLARMPSHVPALNNLGTLLARTGFRGAARLAFTEALKYDAQHAAAHVNLALLLIDNDEIAAAREHLERALGLDPGNVQAHQSLAVLLLRRGELDAAHRHGAAGFGSRVELWPYHGTGEPVQLLAIFSALGGNVGIERFVDDRLFAKATVVAEFFDPSTPLPPHDVVFMAVGDPDRCADALDGAERILAQTRAPVINRPDRVRATRRVANARRMATIPGVIAAATAEISRGELASPGAIELLHERGFVWPLLLRTPGHHTGQNFVKVELPEALPEALAQLPGEELLVMEFLDARDADGNVRKYRVLTIDGQLYPLHLAISSEWMVHYFSADMAENAAHRAEDAAFLADWRSVLGATTVATVERIARTLELEYGGLDFSVDAQGRVLLFEANANMVILPPAEGDRWAYRREPVERARDAARAMLVARANL
jgi:hypothetical protein